MWELQVKAILNEPLKCGTRKATARTHQARYQWVTLKKEVWNRMIQGWSLKWPNFPRPSYRLVSVKFLITFKLLREMRSNPTRFRNHLCLAKSAKVALTSFIQINRTFPSATQFFTTLILRNPRLSLIVKTPRWYQVPIQWSETKPKSRTVLKFWPLKNAKFRSWSVLDRSRF